MKFGKARKFKARWTQSIDGSKHPSEGEAKWWDGLLLRVRAGLIANLKPKPRYKLFIARDCPHCAAHGEYVGAIEFDAEFDADGAHHLLDYKGVEGDTPLSKFKRRIAQARFGVAVEIVGPAAKRAAREQAKRQLASASVSRSRKT